MDVLAEGFLEMGGCMWFCVMFPLYRFLSPPPRLARHLQKEAQSQHNNSEFTEDQKVSVAVHSVKELDSEMLMCIMGFLMLQTRVLFSSLNIGKQKQSPAWPKQLLSLDVTDAPLRNIECRAC